MQVTINNQIYTYSNNIRDNDKIRHSFNSLATQTFGLSFFDGDVMTCYDIFGSCGYKMEDILHTVAKPNTKQIILGFTPKEY